MSNETMTQNVSAEDGSAGSGGQRRLLIAVGGAALLLVLGLGAYFLFLSGGGEEDLGPIPSAAVTIPAKAAGNDNNANTDNGNTDKGDDSVPAKVDSNYSVGRDPFEPLAAEAVPEPVASTDTTTTDTSTDTSTGTGTGTNPAPSGDAPPADTGATTWSVTIKSVKSAQNLAVIDVNGQSYNVKVGEMFTDSQTGPFKLISVGQLPSGKDTGTVTFGSESQVELAAGETFVFSTI
ncbi:MAG: hypothetical protein LH645_13955 [Actinomycetia bacterium]|nr:hypothetical protein [Actinomycetes bacterium]